MKKEVIKMLKEKGRFDLFTDERLEILKNLLRKECAINPAIRGYLQIDPFHKYQWITDHFILLESKFKENNV